MYKKYLGIWILLAVSTVAVAGFDWHNELPFVEHKQKVPRTLVFSQATLKYPLNTELHQFSYYERWNDWPLFINSNLNGQSTYAGLTDKEYEFIVKTAELYGLDGFSVFLPSDKKIPRERELWRLNDCGEGNFKLMPMWMGKDKENGLCLPLESKSSLKVNGKVVVLFYSGLPNTQYKEIITKAKKRFGDKFIFLLTTQMYSNIFVDKFHKDILTKEDISDLENKVGELLRIGDGFYFSNRPRDYYGNGSFDQPLYEMMVRVIAKAMEGPEFKDKYLALTVGAEHSNTYRLGHSLLSDGTKTLRRFMETALKFKPDFINIPEWDEENENTSLRPTVFNGLALMRIMRFYTGKLKGEKDFSLPGDNLKVPNLILTSRKILTLGEKLKIELLNVPDNNIHSKYSAVLKLKNIDGKIVYTFPEANFEADKLQDVNCVVPSEEFASERVLIPELEILTPAGTMLKKTAFSAIILSPVSNHDYKEVHQPVRDIIIPEKCQINISDAGTDAINVSADIDFPEKVRYLELLENGCCVYSFSGEILKWRDNSKYAVLDVSLMSALAGRSPVVSGSITVSCPDAEWRSLGVVNRGLRISKNKLYFKDMKVDNWEARALTAIPREKLTNTRIVVDIPGYYQNEFSFAELIKKQNYVFNGKDGFMLSFNRQFRQAGHVLPQDREHFTFETIVWPEKSNSILQLQAIGATGKIWRSKPLSLPKIAEVESARVITVFSDTANAPVELKVAASRVPDICYVFKKDHGITLESNAGRCFWGSRGGFLLHANYKGGGATGLYGIVGVPATTLSYPQDADNTVPELRDENGESVLVFDGKGNFITLPQNVVPSRAGFTIKIDLFPEINDNNERLIIGATVPGGAHAGLRVFIKNGMLSYEYMPKSSNRIYRDTGIEVPMNKWSSLDIVYDLKNIKFILNGKSSLAFPCSGPGIADSITAVGGFGKDKSYYKGKIKSLCIKHSLNQ